jgi:hypothetical protein
VRTSWILSPKRWNHCTPLFMGTRKTFVQCKYCKSQRINIASDMGWLEREREREIITNHFSTMICFTNHNNWGSSVLVLSTRCFSIFHPDPEQFFSLFWNKRSNASPRCLNSIQTLFFRLNTYHDHARNSIQRHKSEQDQGSESVRYPTLWSSICFFSHIYTSHSKSSSTSRLVTTGHRGLQK